MAKWAINSHLLIYDESSPSFLRWSGSAHWRVRGKVAGSNKGYPYYRTKIDGHLVANHIWIYKMFYGDIPEGYQIDHKDGNPMNNRKENLRLATNAENQWNSAPNKVKLSRLPKNIHKMKYGKFRACLWKNKQRYLSGNKDTIEECLSWLKEKRKELHGEFARGD
ncbi:HNH endonuclease [Klebsiella phage vB_KpnM_NDO71]|nr:HNH endonuclease [Klebsiella phage vB_KpnM_NDO71]